MPVNPPAVSDSVPEFNAWSFVRRAIEYGVAIEQDSRKQDRTYDQHSTVIDLRASILSAELKAQLTTLQQALGAKTRECEDAGEVDSDCWANSNRYQLKRMVDMCSIEQLRQIADVLGYKEQPHDPN